MHRCRWLAAAGATGGALFCAKGAIRATAGDDVSLVPSALPLMGLGLWGLADMVARTSRSHRAVIAGRVFGAIAVVSGAVAFGFFVTGTIPESDNAPAAVGASYAVGAASLYLGQVVLGIAAARRKALPGRLRWVPLAVVVFQFPVFIVAGAIGDGIGDEAVTDGLGMLLTGGLWVASNLAVWKAADSAPGANPATRPAPSH